MQLVDGPFHVLEIGPGAYRQGARLYLRTETTLIIRTNLEIVFEDDGLTIEDKVFERLVVFQSVEHLLHDVDEVNAEVVKRPIPLPIPVGVRNDVDLFG